MITTEDVDNSFVEKAITFAVEKHSGQKRWNGEPYILHPLRVMTKMKSNIGRCVAVLHDVIEDTDATFEDLVSLGFDDHEIILPIKRLTRTENEDYFDFINRVKFNPVSLRVKIVDLKDNLNIWDLREKQSDIFIDDKHRLRMNKYLSALQILYREPRSIKSI